MKSRFNAVCSTDNLAKIKDGAYVVSLDKYESVETYWIVLYVKGYLCQKTILCHKLALDVESMNFFI